MQTITYVAFIEIYKSNILLVIKNTRLRKFTHDILYQLLHIEQKQEKTKAQIFHYII